MCWPRWLFASLLTFGSWAQAISIDCETYSGDDIRIQGKLKSLDSRENQNLPLTIGFNGRTFHGTVFQALIEPPTQRLYLQIIIDEYTAANSDRTLEVMASWLGDRGDPVYAQGVLVQSFHNHKTGVIREGPQQKLQCQIESLP